jgi:hypothetical protein
MARLWVVANTEYFTSDTTPVTAAPFTVAAWFYPADATNYKTICYIGDKDVADHYFLLQLGGTGAVKVRATARGNVSQTATSTANYSASVWQHAAAVFASATSRTAYLDGVAGTENTVSQTPSGCDRIAIGGNRDSTPDDYFGGRIAELGIWNVALTAGEIQSLADGMSPLRVRRTSLVRYYPLPANTGDAFDYSGNAGTLTDTNTVSVADHAPVGPMFGYDLGEAYQVSAAVAERRLFVVS